ncbi:hypothetical protein ACROYT_G041042 [Oculina patagonica]
MSKDVSGKNKGKADSGKSKDGIMCCVIIVSFLTPLGKESDDPKDLRSKLDEDRRRAARDRLFNERRFPKGDTPMEVPTESKPRKSELLSRSTVLMYVKIFLKAFF